MKFNWYFALFNTIISYGLLFIDMAIGTTVNPSSGILSSFYIQKTKFKLLLSAYDGYAPEERKEGVMYGFSYLSQGFKAKISSSIGEVYYEYWIIKLGGDLYDVIITGRINKKETNQLIVEKLFKNIKVQN